MAIVKDADVITLIDKAIMKYKGNTDELAKAIGVFMLGRKIGWRTTFLLHSVKTIKKYEGILSVDFRNCLPEKGPKTEKIVAWIVSQKVSNFWKLVKGEIPNVRTPDWADTK